MWSSLLFSAAAGIGEAVPLPSFLTSLLVIFMGLASMTVWSLEDED
jgi:hypothetical protein